MADRESFSLVYMRTHPADAARVLESVPPDEAVKLLANAPARVAAPVLGEMLPAAGARCAGGLTDERLLALLGELGTQSVVSLLRHVPEPRRTRLIEGLPTVAALASKLLMGYVEDSVGAWADLDVLALPGATRASDALERMRHVEATVQRVFVTGADSHLEGWVPLSVLLRAPAGANLAAIMREPEGVLSAQAPLSGALTHPGWSRTSVMPVVEAGNRVLGVLTRDALTRALRPPVRETEDTLVGALARSYWDALSGGAEAMATLLPTVRPVAGARDER